MLAPVEVAPYLNDPDPLISDFALRFLGDSQFESPVSVEAVWKGIEHPRSRHAPLGRIRLLMRMPPASVELPRLLACIKKAPNRTVSDRLADVAVQSPLQSLGEALQSSSACEGLPGAVVQRMRRAVQLREQSAVQAGAQLLDLGARWDQERMRIGFDTDLELPRILTSVLATEQAHAKAWAFSILQSPDLASSWAGVFAIDVLGAARAQEAVRFLIDLVVRETDYARDRALFALAALGTPEVVQAVEERVAPFAWTAASEILGRIKLPESEQAALRMLRTNGVDNDLSWPALALCNLGTTDGFDDLLRLTATDALDNGLADFRSELTILGKLQHRAFAQMEQWHQRALMEFERQHRELDRFVDRLAIAPAAQAPSRAAPRGWRSSSKKKNRHR